MKKSMLTPNTKRTKNPKSPAEIPFWSFWYFWGMEGGDNIPNQWIIYKNVKRRLQHRGLSPEQYERELKKPTLKLKV